MGFWACLIFCKGKNVRSVSKVIITQVMSGLCLVDVA